MDYSTIQDAWGPPGGGAGGDRDRDRAAGDRDRAAGDRDRAAGDRGAYEAFRDGRRPSRRRAPPPGGRDGDAPRPQHGKPRRSWREDGVMRRARSGDEARRPRHRRADAEGFSDGGEPSPSSREFVSPLLSSGRACDAPGAWEPVPSGSELMAASEPWTPDRTTDPAARMPSPLQTQHDLQGPHARHEPAPRDLGPGGPPGLPGAGGEPGAPADGGEPGAPADGDRDGDRDDGYAQGGSYGRDEGGSYGRDEGGGDRGGDRGGDIDRGGDYGRDDGDGEDPRRSPDARGAISGTIHRLARRPDPRSHASGYDGAGSGLADAGRADAGASYRGTNDVFMYVFSGLLLIFLVEQAIQLGAAIGAARSSAVAAALAAQAARSPGCFVPM